jgi:hypothetical protein
MNRVDLVQKSIVRDVRRHFRSVFSDTTKNADKSLSFFEKILMMIDKYPRFSDLPVEREEFAVFMCGFLDVDQMKAESKTGLNKVLCGYSYRRISRKIKVLTGCIHKTTKALIRKSMECPEFSILVRFFFDDQQNQQIEMTNPY